MRKFNITAVCVPDKDYMVDISRKIDKIKALVDEGCYFTINRARQYGKTTTLNRLKTTLANEYLCVNMSFEGVGNAMFENAQSFCNLFLKMLQKIIGFPRLDAGRRSAGRKKDSERKKYPV